MSVQSEINRISGNVTAALAAIAEKGVTVDSGSTSDDLATLISNIEAGSGGGAVELTQLSVTPTEDTSKITIEHGLGHIPIFCAISYTNKADNALNSSFRNVLAAAFVYNGVYVHAGTSYYAATHSMICRTGVNADITVPTSSSVAWSFDEATERTVEYNGAYGGGGLNAGMTYNVYVG